MIPKIIHYCWFGEKPLPALARQCLKSWKKYCPNYEIKRWDENNFDINICQYVKEAYEAKKYAFVTDFVRLWVLLKFGGIYMDTDVEVLKSLDPILKYKAISGFESNQDIPTGLMGSEANFPLFNEFLKEYDNLSFVFTNNANVITNVTRITNTCLKYGLKRNNTKQTIEGFTLLPKEYFCPTDKYNLPTPTKNSYTIHHFAGSWNSPLIRIKIKIVKFIGLHLGTQTLDFLFKIKRKFKEILKKFC